MFSNLNKKIDLQAIIQFWEFEGRGELNFYDLRKRYLHKGAIALKDKMPIKISERWTFNISH